MKASEMIKQIETLMLRHGDLDIATDGYYGVQESTYITVGEFLDINWKPYYTIRIPAYVFGPGSCP